MMAIDPRTIKGQYEQGRITLTEVVIRAAQAAVNESPDAFVDLLPAECVPDLRAAAADPPPAGKTVIHGMVSVAGPADPTKRSFDYDGYFAEQSRLYREGLLRWRDYFARADAVSAAPPGLPETG
jgi:hypothetical protein